MMFDLDVFKCLHYCILERLTSIAQEELSDLMRFKLLELLAHVFVRK
jgi:hypothetical protein